VIYGPPMPLHRPSLAFGWRASLNPKTRTSTTPAVSGRDLKKGMKIKAVVTDDEHAVIGQTFLLDDHKANDRTVRA
jgi:hypothetical protein